MGQSGVERRAASSGMGYEQFNSNRASPPEQGNFFGEGEIFPPRSIADDPPTQPRLLAGAIHQSRERKSILVFGRLDS